MRASHEGKFLTSTKREPSFISKGFTYWKERTTVFKKHQASDCHREATEALVELPRQIKGNIEEVLSNEVKQERAINRRVFLAILENILFLACQGWHCDVMEIVTAIFTSFFSFEEMILNLLMSG